MRSLVLLLLSAGLGFACSSPADPPPDGGAPSDSFVPGTDTGPDTGPDTDADTPSALCGDDRRDPGELCDGPDVGGRACTDFAYTGGTLGCLADCQDLDFSGCTSDAAVCGNGVAEAGELCDGTDVGATCASLGMGDGTVACAADCLSYDTTGCGGTASRPPVILSFTSNVAAITEGESVTFSIIATDPDGVDDIIGGTMGDPSTGMTYGALATSAAEGAYTITLSWDEIHRVRPIDFTTATPRTFEVTIFDVAGSSVTATRDITLTCDGEVACDGMCGPPRWDDHCGTCGNACLGGGTCGSDAAGAYVCQCGGANEAYCTGRGCIATTTVADCGGCGIACSGATSVCSGRTGTYGCTYPAPGVGDIVITEVLWASRATTSSLGRYVEFYNPSTATYDIGGCTVSGRAIDGNVVIAPGAIVTVASSWSPGFTPDGVFVTTPDLSMPTLTLDCAGTAVDTTIFAQGAVTSGYSRELSWARLDASLNDTNLYICNATEMYTALDYGTPGAPNTCIR